MQDVKFVTADSIDFAQIELVFLALPHGESAALIAKLPSHLKIVDLGADFRLKIQLNGKSITVESTPEPGCMDYQSLHQVNARR